MIVRAQDVPVNPVMNGNFELFVPFAAAALSGTPLDGPGVGVGHQVLGCTHTANVIFSTDCHGRPTDSAAEAGAIAADPASEVGAWTTPGAQNGDLAIVAPADQSAFNAVDWSQYPAKSIAFGDHNGDGDREALILPGNQMLYQSFASASPHTAVPAGTIKAVTLRLEAGAPAGSLALVLDSFPLESATDWPQAFVNYQLFVPAGAWTVDHGAVTIDPLAGSLWGPAPGAYIVDAGGHPTAAQWTAADAAGRHAILMQLRVTQMTFWNLAPGTMVDDVAFQLDV